jgi:hypothetical protein
MQPVNYACNTADNAILPVSQPVLCLAMLKSGILIPAQRMVLIKKDRRNPIGTATVQPVGKTDE